jgi:hypothetical protein
VRPAVRIAENVKVEICALDAKILSWLKMDFANALKDSTTIRIKTNVNVMNQQSMILNQKAVKTAAPNNSSNKANASPIPS